MCQAFPSFYSDFNEKLPLNSVSSDFYEKYIVDNRLFVSSHNSYCSLENCEFHILLIGLTFDQVLQRIIFIG